MAMRRILVLYGKSLLAQGVEQLLKRAGGLEVIGVDLDRRGAMGEISTLHPEVVIVDGDDVSANAGSLILQVLRENPSVKVFCISVSGSNVDVYRKSQVSVTETDQLLAAINME